jgi:hypothetical protein
MLTNPLPPNNGGFNLPSPPSLKRQGLESILNKSILLLETVSLKKHRHKEMGVPYILNRHRRNFGLTSSVYPSRLLI